MDVLATGGFDTGETRGAPPTRNEKPVYRLAHSAPLEGETFDALCHVMRTLTHTLANVLMPAREYPALIKAYLPEESPALTLLDNLEASTEKLCQITKNIVALCHGNEDDPSDVDLKNLTRQVLADVEDDLGAEVHTRVSLPQCTPPPVVRGPHDGLYHLVRNLCLNAFEQMGDRGHLTVRIESLTACEGGVEQGLGVAAGTYLAFQFKDNGPGVAAECRDTLFDPFVSTSCTGGRGLGLSMVYRTMRHVGGYILYTSDDASGADFKLLFPATSPA